MEDPTYFPNEETISAAVVTEVEAADGNLDIVVHSRQHVYVVHAIDVHNIAKTSPASGSSILDMAVADRWVVLHWSI